MPIYEYECRKCGHTLEALQRLADKPLRECPECGKHQLKRLVSAPLFRLAGSGWYETDFKSDKENKRNLVGKGEAEPAKAEATVEAKPESKPADKVAPAGESKSRVIAPKPAAKAGTRARTRAPARPSKSVRSKQR
jgi:putative FmdB family regulatory protein